MEAKLTKKDDHYFLEIKPDTLNTSQKYTIIANTLDKPKGEILQLSLKNCQAIGRGYDLDELIAKKVNDFNIVDKAVEFSNANPKNNGAYLAYIAGAYEMAKQLELMSDKKFSEFLDKEKELGISDIKTIERIQWYYNTYFDKSQQTEWDVDVKMRSKDIDELRESGEGFLNNKNLYVPELDADGCLILTRIYE